MIIDLKHSQIPSHKKAIKGYFLSKLNGNIVLGLVHTYPDNFENASFFIHIKSIHVHTRSVFENISVYTKTLFGFKLHSSNFDKRKQTIKMPLCDPQSSVRICYDGSAFSKSFIFGDQKRHLRVDTNLKRIKKDAFSKISGYMWMGPYTTEILCFVTDSSVWFLCRNQTGECMMKYILRHLAVFFIAAINSSSPFQGFRLICSFSSVFLHMMISLLYMLV